MTPSILPSGEGANPEQNEASKPQEMSPQMVFQKLEPIARQVDIGQAIKDKKARKPFAVALVQTLREYNTQPNREKRIGRKPEEYYRALQEFLERSPQTVELIRACKNGNYNEFAAISSSIDRAVHERIGKEMTVRGAEEVQKYARGNVFDALAERGTEPEDVRSYAARKKYGSGDFNYQPPPRNTEGPQANT